jgi:hypothetical protein
MGRGQGIIQRKGMRHALCIATKTAGKATAPFDGGRLGQTRSFVPSLPLRGVSFLLTGLMSIVAVNIQRIGYALAGGLGYFIWESA